MISTSGIIPAKPPKRNFPAKQRFCVPVSAGKMAICKGIVPPNTRKATSWARDITGHRSKSLELYERPSLHQRQSVSRVLVQGQPFEKDNCNPQQSSHKIQLLSVAVLMCLDHFFLQLLCPQNFVVNVGTSVSSDSMSHLLDGISLEQFLE